MTNIYDLRAPSPTTSPARGTSAATRRSSTSRCTATRPARSRAFLLMASLPEANGAVKGLTKPQIVENLVAPQRSAIEFEDAFENLRSDAGTCTGKENEAWVFLEQREPAEEDREIRRSAPRNRRSTRKCSGGCLRPSSRGARSPIGGPRPAEDRGHQDERRTRLPRPQPRQQDSARGGQALFEAVTEKNNFCVVTGDGSSLAKLEDKARRIWAVAKVLDETGGDKSPHKTELDEEAEQAELEFNSTVVSLFNRVYYPTRNGLTPAKLGMTFTGNQFRAEDQIEKALTDVGASKLVTNVEANAEMLMTRAEEMLWSGTERRVPWRDVVSRAIDQPRWPWLPPKGLERLRKIAEGQGRWRYTEDGYIEKGPFPPPRTSVSISERDYKEETGQATIEVLARNAGPNGRVHYRRVPTSRSIARSSQTRSSRPTRRPLVPGGRSRRRAPDRGFRALVEQAEPHPRTQVAAGGKRIVELTVKPRGDIRWNTTGANPKEGQVYTGPIELSGDAEVTIYAYAEDQGVGTQRSFIIPKPDQAGPTIDKCKPAKLHKKLDFHDNAKSFAALNSAKGVQARLRGSTSKSGPARRTS